MIHINSRKSYKEEAASLGNREREIFNYLMMTRREYTDRQLAKEMGFEHRSLVQPRISGLIDKGLVMECGKAKCNVTGKLVRMIKLAKDSPQQELF